MDIRQAAQQRSQNRTQAGIGPLRQAGFPAQYRSEQVMQNGKSLIKLKGVASTVEQPYQMYDMFGPYNEVISRTAFDHTLAQQPDVAYLLNHTGMTMARTSNGTLSLAANPDTGLETEALVNPQRSDVSDMLTAIGDGDVNEMSFAFTIDDGQWNDDMSEYRIHRVNLHRGDVSAVNFGANPNTTAARSQMILRELAQLPHGAQVEARDRLNVELRAEVGTDDDAETDSAETDGDADPVQMIQAIDAALDEAQNLIGDTDTSTLPPNVAQALGLISSAGATVDALMEAQGIDDPDERTAAIALATRELDSVLAATVAAQQAVANAREEATAQLDGLVGEAETRDDRSELEERKAEPVHHTEVVDEAWDGPAAVKAMAASADVLAACHAWVDSKGDPDKKASYKFPHHKVKGGPANLKACQAILGSFNGSHGNTPDIPSGDIAGVKAHAQAHIDDWDKKNPKKESETPAPGRSVRLLEHIIDAA